MLSVVHAVVALAALAASLAMRDPRVVGFVVPVSLLVAVYAKRGDDCRSSLWTAANAVTLVRLALSMSIGLSSVSDTHAAAAIVLCFFLDGLDGRVARSRGTSSALSGAFDMEADAALVLVSSVRLALGTAPCFVIVAGAFRYVYAVALALFPWARGEAPRSTLGRFVFAIVVNAHAAALLLPEIAVPLLGLSTALLAYSFARSAWWSFLGPPAEDSGVDASLASDQHAPPSVPAREHSP